MLRKVGAGFEDAVTEVLVGLAEGQVVSYGWVAKEAGFPGRARAVGRFLSHHGGGLPWWRVVRADGRLAAPDPSRQAALLRDEGVAVVDGRVRGGHHPILRQLCGGSSAAARFLTGRRRTVSMSASPDQRNRPTMRKNRLLASFAVAAGLVAGGATAIIFGPTASGAQTPTTQAPPSTSAPAPNADGTTPPADRPARGENCPEKNGAGGQAPATGSSTRGAASTQQPGFRRV